MSIEPDTLDKSIDRTIDRQTPDTAPVMSDELFNSMSKSVLQSAKAIQEAALVELQQQMNDLTSSFSDRAVAIVEDGFKNCFFHASQRIRDLQISWTSDVGGILDGNTIDTIALPGSTTDGAIE